MYPWKLPILVSALGWSWLVLAAGCTFRSSPQPLAKGMNVDLHAVSATKVPGTLQVTVPGSGESLFLITPAIISAADIATVQRTMDSGNMPSLAVHLTPAGATKMMAVPVGTPIAILVNGSVISAPKVNSPLSADFVITGPQDFERFFQTLTKK